MQQLELSLRDSCHRVMNKMPRKTPSFPGTLERPRITRLLEDAVRCPVVSVCAGAGYGKTRAVYSFLQYHKAITTWVQLSRRDNISSRFWENFTHAVSLRNEAFARRLMDAGFPRTDADYEQYLQIPEEAISPAERHVIVFDDFHLLHDEKVLRFVEKSVHASFPNITTILISRAEPEINLVNLLSKGQVVCLTEDELRFTPGETEKFLKQSGLSVSSRGLADICADTRGWAFAVDLIVRSLKKNPRRESYARAAMRINIFRLLESEVFLVVSEALRHFLIRLSLIEHLAADLLQELAAPSLLEEMARINAYVRYDANIDAYLIHPLFLEYLQNRQEALTVAEKHETWLTAARWCTRNDYKIDALSYYSKANAYAPLMQVIYDLSSPPPVATAQYALEILDDAPQEALEQIAIYPLMRLRLLLALRRVDEAIAFASRCVERYEVLEESPFNNRVLTGCHIGLGYARLMSAHATDNYDFVRHFRMANDYYSRTPYPIQGPTVSHNLGAWVLEIGTERPGAAEEFIEALSRTVPYMAHITGGGTSGLDDLARGELLFYRNSQKPAEKFLTQALRTARENRQHDIRNRALFYLLRIGVAQGDYGRIETITRELKTLLDEPDYPNRYVTHDIVMAWHYLLLGQAQLVADWLKTDFEQNALAFQLAELGNRVKARYYFLSRRYQELLAFLAGWKMPHRLLFARIDAKTQEAICRYRIKERDGALENLRHAYEMAHSNAIVMSFVQHGKDMRTLTAAALRDKRSSIPQDWLENINRQSATYAKRQSIAIASYKKAHCLDDTPTLSARESDILTDLYHGLSRSEISASRKLSINTVKLIINTLYAKLGADNAIDAIRIAAKKKLIIF
jgi:LuxR family maltose regulon positive regulatory protein